MPLRLLPLTRSLLPRVVAVRAAAAPCRSLHFLKHPSALSAQTSPLSSPAVVATSGPAVDSAAALNRGFHASNRQSTASTEPQTCDPNVVRQMAQSKPSWGESVQLPELRSLLEKVDSNQRIYVDVKSANEESAQGNIEHCLEMPASALLSVVNRVKAHHTDRVQLEKYTDLDVQPEGDILHVTVYGDNSDFARKLKKHTFTPGQSHRISETHFPRHQEQEEWVGDEYHSGDQRFNQTNNDSAATMGNPPRQPPSRK
ncbi:hypothetical protein RI367_002058 [Sorochytrium milnesiophthora]